MRAFNGIGGWTRSSSDTSPSCGASCRRAASSSRRHRSPHPAVAGGWWMTGTSGTPIRAGRRDAPGGRLGPAVFSGAGLGPRADSVAARHVGGHRACHVGQAEVAASVIVRQLLYELRSWGQVSTPHLSPLGRGRRTEGEPGEGFAMEEDPSPASFAGDLSPAGRGGKPPTA